MALVRYCTRLRRWILPGFALVLLIAALPGAGRLANPAAWNTPLAARQFAEWSQALRGVGVSLTSAEFERLLWRLTRGYLVVRSALQWPLTPLISVFGLEQSWTLFATPQTDPCRLEVQVETAAGWAIVYQSRSEVHAWQRDFFDQHRVRKLIGRLGRNSSSRYWDAFVAWISKRAFDEMPDVRRVRIVLYRWQTPSPGSNEAWALLSERGKAVRTAIERRQGEP